MLSFELRIPPVLVVLVTALCMWLISRAAPLFHFDVPAHNAIAVVLVSAGFVMGISSVITFRRAKTTVDPTKPRASSLVTWGVYAISRNPMYVGFLVILIGWAVLLRNAFAFLFLAVFVLYINRFQIVPEERALASLFGETYGSYRMRVRRWV